MASSTVVDHQRLEAAVQLMLGQHAAATCCSTDGDLSTLAPVERAAIAPAIALRQKEFAAGRAAAREAMRRLGRPAAAIPMQHDRSPRWPADLVGSISHSRATCVSVVALKSHWKAVGVDVEQDSDLSREMWDLICVPNELQRMATLPESVRARWMMRIFSAKEAYYKYVYSQVGRVLEFDEVEIVMDATMASTGFQVHPLHCESTRISSRHLSGKLIVDQGMLISLMIH